MVYLVIGGGGSGKSQYAEDILREIDGKKYYIATMRVYDPEGEKKVARHRKLRQGKGFVTIEKETDIQEIVLSSTEEASGLLECLSNLLANEMFPDDGEPADGEKAADKIIGNLKALSKQLCNLVIVSNNVFEDGRAYDEGTTAYLSALGKINCEAAKMADRVIEVVVGIPVVLKEEICS